MSVEHQQRVVDQELHDLLGHLPAISIEGPRAVGKTWTANRLANTVYALDDPETLAEVRADPRLLTRGAPPILIDEWQRFPASWDIVRRSVDRDFSPKHHLADTALAARLLHATADTLTGRDTGPHAGPGFVGSQTLGALFESMVVHDLRVYAQPADARVSHMRTWNDLREADAVIEHRGRMLAVEVKLGAEVTGRDTRHLRWLRDRLGPALIDALVVTTGAHAYRDEDGIAVVPAALLGP